MVDPETAADPGAPQVHEELARNVAIRRIDEGDPLDDAEVVVRARIENNRLATAPIEGNAVLADPTGDEAGHRLTVWLSTQHPHLGKSLLARFTGLDKKEIRVVAPHVGGAFGGKAGISPDHAAVVAAAPRTSAGRSRGPRPAARRCCRCTAAARCSTSSSGSPGRAGSPACRRG